MGRAEDFETIINLVGSDVAQIVDTQNGWPGLAKVKVVDEWVDVSIFAAPVSLSNRNRDATERRFQNPGQDRPILIPPNTTPLLIGLWHSDPLATVNQPVLVLADAALRVGRLTRYSIFLHLESLNTSANQGWCQRENTSGEMIQYFWPAYLPAIAGALSIDGRLPSKIAEAFLAPVDLAEPTPAERTYAVTLRIVRSTRFARDVRLAYDGRCAMCGVGMDLCEAAHILQVAADGPDEIANGVYLCRNHHAAFDRHQIWVDPSSRAIMYDLSKTDTHTHEDVAFIASTFAHLAEPSDPRLRPASHFFVSRYSSSDGAYDWVDNG